MQKTTVYLKEDEADGIRKLAAVTGKSQAELIREGVRRVLARSTKRKFHSMGVGEADREHRPAHWSPEEVYEKAFGRDQI